MVKQHGLDRGALSQLQSSYWKPRFSHLDNFTSNNSREAPYELIERDNNLLVRFEGVHYTFGFEIPSPTGDEVALHLYAVVRKNRVDDVRHALSQKLGNMPKDAIKKYHKIFHDPHVEHLEETHPLVAHAGYNSPLIHILSSVKEIPHGPQGRLSSNIFDLFRKFCFSPTHQVLRL
ncbi:hypothetical protein KW805_01265 [Candidatus Pacearchaeota archaeon]|nr:hypothetical protein [Candidatus Pacearchaeota archaeon]